MTTNIRLRRSAVTGNIPTTGQLDLGEVAINTFDGNLFIKKNDGAESIVTIKEVTEDNLLVDSSALTNSSATNLSGVLSDLDGSIGSGGGGGITWARKTSNYTAVTGDGIIADTAGGTFTVTLPATPATGDTIIVADGADWSTINLIIARNGSTVEGLSEDLIVDLGGIQVQLIS